MIGIHLECEFHDAPLRTYGFPLDLRGNTAKVPPNRISGGLRLWSTGGKAKVY